MDTQKVCEHCQTRFTISPDELSMYEKVAIPLPTQCFSCRMKHYFAFWPFGKFRKGTSDLSGENLITILPASARYPIYTSSEWFSDAWDPMSFGLTYDPSRSFFDQLKELQEKVPRPHQQGAQNTNSDWCDDAWECKNCYLSRSIARSENLSYGYRAFDTKDSIDISHVFNLDNCYECTYTFNSFNVLFSRNCRDCMDSQFLYDCRNCTNCTMCWNLRGKQYCIENKQYSKEEYVEKLKEYDLSSNKSLEKLKERYEEILKKDFVHRQNFTLNTYNSEGTYLANCNNCHNVFSFEDSENCYDCLRGRTATDCIDMLGCWQIELSGRNSCATAGYQLKYSSWSDGRYSEYLDQCAEVEYCFGCVGLRKKKYCILNKQYTKEEYESLRETIISDMRARNEYGQFLPYNMGLCPYNLTTAQIYFPEVSREFVLSQGGYWDDSREDHIEGIATNDLPDSIHDISGSISKQALICPVTGWRFNIAPDELAFLKRKNIALPRVHFDVRTKSRMRLLAPTQGENYSCFYCSKNIVGYYPRSWGYENVSCEDCYKSNIS